VVWNLGVAQVVAGPKGPVEDLRHVLETHGNQHHNAFALLDMRKHPAAYFRELVQDKNWHAVPFEDWTLR
jgi:DNA polymerase III epsilon subunit-like protein